jgi:hypothetical protein
MLETIKNEICRLNCELPKNNLAVWTGGNVSVRAPSILTGADIPFENHGTEDDRPAELVDIFPPSWRLQVSRYQLSFRGSTCSAKHPERVSSQKCMPVGMNLFS